MNSKISQAPGQEMGICVLNLVFIKVIALYDYFEGVLNKMIVISFWHYLTLQYFIPDDYYASCPSLCHFLKI